MTFTGIAQAFNNGAYFMGNYGKEDWVVQVTFGVGLCFVLPADSGQAGNWNQSKLSIRKSRSAGLLGAASPRGGRRDTEPRGES